MGEDIFSTSIVSVQDNGPRERIDTRRNVILQSFVPETKILLNWDSSMSLANL